MCKSSEKIDSFFMAELRKYYIPSPCLKPRPCRKAQCFVIGQNAKCALCCDIYRQKNNFEAAKGCQNAVECQILGQLDRRWAEYRQSPYSCLTDGAVTWSS